MLKSTVVPEFNRKSITLPRKINIPHHCKFFTLAFLALSVALISPAWGQVSGAEATSQVAPQAVGKLVRWTGTLPEAAAASLPQAASEASTSLSPSGSRLVEMHFAIYQNQAGGLPLWTETQRVRISTDGRYTVLLGATNPEGLPQELFPSGESRWVEASLTGATRIPGTSSASPRSLLAAVPYAFKATDAETLAGRPAADYITRDELQSAVTSAVVPAPQVAGAVTGAGTTGYIPVWTGAATLGNSIISAAGTKVGIGTAAPATTLDVNGATTLRSSVKLTSGIAATATTAASSPTLQFGASSFSSATAAAVAQNYAWQAIPTGNNTATPAASLALLFGAGANAPKTTGLAIAPTGQITFAAGQKFPGTGGGTITGVTAGTGLKGGGISGVVTLNVDTTRIPQLSTYNTFASGASFGGESVWNGSSTDWMMVVTNTSATAKGTILGQAVGTQLAIEGASPGGVGVKGASDTGAGIEGVSNTTGTAVLAIANGSGQAGFFRSGSTTQSAVTVVSTGASALTATANSGSAGYFSNSGTFSAAVYSANTGNGNAGYFQNNSASRVSLAGVNSSTDAAAVGVYGNVANGQAVYGLSTSGKAVYGTSTSGIGVYGTTTGSDGVAGLATKGNGVYGYASTGIGVFAASSSGTALYADAPSSGVPTAWFVQGSGSNQPSAWQQLGEHSVLWTDTGTSGNEAIIGTSLDSTAAIFGNNSKNNATLYVANLNTNEQHSLFKTLQAASSDGICGIGSGGNLTCTGQVKTLASVGGARKVETYSVQSPENWMEDFGSGNLSKGVALVTIDPAFAETVTASADYHVFLTPNGDSKGLYVIRKTATSFEVRESGGGTASLSFDYRIVARRRGFEKQRLTDVTERFNRESVAPRLPTRPAEPVTQP